MNIKNIILIVVAAIVAIPAFANDEIFSIVENPEIPTKIEYQEALRAFSIWEQE